MIISLYLQLLGHNRDKYLIFWVGGGHNGKSLVLALLRRVLGPLAASLDKSILFRTKGKSKTCAGYDMQLVGIRSGTIDELSRQDELDDQAVKRIVSADVKVAMKEAYNHKKGAAKASFNISCSILMCYNDGSLPKFHRDAAMLNRIRIIRFPALFVNRQLTEEEEADDLVYRADIDLPVKLQDQRVQEQFLNFIITYGRFYYHRAKAARSEPLPPNEEAKKLQLGPDDPICVNPKPDPIETIQEWFARRTLAQPGSHVSIDKLAALYCQDFKVVFQKPVQEFWNRLYKKRPDLA